MWKIDRGFSMFISHFDTEMAFLMILKNTRILKISFGLIFGSGKQSVNLTCYSCSPNQ